MIKFAPHGPGEVVSIDGVGHGFDVLVEKDGVTGSTAESPFGIFIGILVDRVAVEIDFIDLDVIGGGGMVGRKGAAVIPRPVR